jgi:tetratricopeptide (TPR) repeat protein
VVLLTLAAAPRVRAAPEAPKADAKAKPSAQAAQALARDKAWDDLFLQFSAGDPKAFPAADRATIADALLAGATDLAGSDGVMAVSLVERSIAFKEQGASLRLAGKLNQQLEQSGQAARFFERALDLDPKDAEARLLRAELAVKEGEGALALKALETLPAAYEPARAGKAREGARALEASRKANQDAVSQLQKDRAALKAADKGPKKPSAVAVAEEPVAQPMGNPEQSRETVGMGLKQRALQHFTFAYGTNGRDEFQKDAYEDQAMAVLEEAYEFVGATLSANRSKPVDVVLYTKKEYDFHFGGSELSRAAGFFSGKIRINGAEKFTPEVKATVVHEYLHAVVDELTGGKRVPQWVNEGLATWVENEYRASHHMQNADAAWWGRLKLMATKGQLPPLDQLDVGFLGLSNPRLGYATAGQGVKLLVEARGVENFVSMLRDTGSGPFSDLLKSRYTTTTTDLDYEIKSSLSK